MELIKEIYDSGSELYYFKNNKFMGTILVYSSLNCKSFFVENLSGISDSVTKQDLLKELLKETRNNKIVFYLNCHIESDAEYLKETYSLLSETIIPIGYHDKYQYHLILQNPYCTNEGHIERIEKEGVLIGQHLKKIENKVIKEKSIISLRK